MSQREIDLNRCLFHYTNITCSRCQDICPKQAIAGRVIDEKKCDNCGLCTAVCPTGAIHSDADYDSCLTATQKLAPQVLMCQKVSPSAMPCLGALNRRLLWALAEKRPLAIDTSRCESCNPAVHSWLSQEIRACNEALEAAGKPPLKLVHVKESPAPPASTVGRRSFFRSLFAAAKDTATEIAEAQTQRQYTFDEIIWLTKQEPPVSPCKLFPGFSLTAPCNGCGLCAALCPEKALTITDGNQRQLHFNPRQCTNCGLCSANCPQSAIQLLPQFQGAEDFPVTSPEDDTPPSQSGFHLTRN